MFENILTAARRNRNRLATVAVLASGAAITGMASAQTAPATFNAAPLASASVSGVTDLISSGGPAVFGLVGLATGLIFLINRVRSLG